MTIQIDANLLIVIIVTLSVILLFVSTAFIILLQNMIRIKKQLDDTNRLLYFNLKSHERLQSSLQEQQDSIDIINQNMKTISHDLEIKIKQDAEKASRKIYPRPELANMITNTIQEQIQIEMSLSKNLKAPPRDYVEVITESVIRTYPEVDPSYLTKKCIALLDNFASEYTKS